MKENTINNALGITMESVAGMLTPPKNVRIEPPIQETSVDVNAIYHGEPNDSIHFIHAMPTIEKFQFVENIDSTNGATRTFDAIVCMMNGRRIKATGTWEDA